MFSATARLLLRNSFKKQQIFFNFDTVWSLKTFFQATQFWSFAYDVRKSECDHKNHKKAGRMLCGMCMCACVCVWFVNLALVHLNSSSFSLFSSFHSKITRLTRSLIIISLHSVSMETYSRKRSSDDDWSKAATERKFKFKTFFTLHAKIIKNSSKNV